MVFRNWIDYSLILFLFSGLTGCYAEVESRQNASKRAIEPIKIAMLEADNSRLIEQYRSELEVLPISEIKVSDFDALMISQTVLDSIQDNPEINNVAKLFIEEKVLLLLEDFAEGVVIENFSKANSNNIVFSGTPPVIAKTFTFLDGKELKGVILSSSEPSNESPTDTIVKVIEQIEEAKKEPAYSSLAGNSDIFSVAGGTGSCSQYLEIIELNQHEYLSNESNDYWVLRLSQLAKEDSSPNRCIQSQDKLRNIQSRLRLNTVTNRIVDYAPTTGKGNQIADLDEDYSWPVGTSDINVVDRGNLPEFAEWVFSFPNYEENHLSLTQPGVIISTSKDQAVSFGRTVEIEFEENRWVLPNSKREFTFDWRVSISD